MLTYFKSTASILLSLPFLAIISCTNKKEQVDMIVFNAQVYVVNEQADTAEAFAIEDGTFIAAGTDNDILEKYESEQKIDLNQKPVYPGFIDAHCHFYNYGLTLNEVDLRDASSFEEVIQKVNGHRSKFPDDKWIIGGGWDQNLWENKEFPSKDTLDLLYPDVPVFLSRVDGHAALVNQKALDIGKVDPEREVSGGIIETKNGKPTGILIDNAMVLIEKIIPKPSQERKIKSLQQAEKNCFAVGLTTVDDAGLDKDIIDLLDSLQKNEALSMRIYAMGTPSQENMDHYFKNGIYKTNRLHVRSFKIYADGALGSRGASLLEPYEDSPGNYGLLLTKAQDLNKIAQDLYEHGFQMNTHCIGDSANRLLTQIYSSVLLGKNDKRWRIEHAQVVSRPDLKQFSDYNIIPSIQPTHATSDMSWAGDRLGQERVKTAYAYKDLVRHAGLVACGSDFPVESINPLWGFHAAVARQNDKNEPENGFNMENGLDRLSALKGMTIWAAFSNFEEKEKGSIEPGKFADFVVLEKDIMKVANEELRDIRVLKTFVGGKEVYSSGM